MINYKKIFFDNYNTNSFAHKFRTKRFELFLKIFGAILNNGKDVNILDVGGTENYWLNMGIKNYHNISILLLNKTKEPTTLSSITSITGDACDLSSFKKNQFDIVFSNSVIEHVGDYNKQQQMANEIIRVGKTFYLQTPNYYFPIEPHFMFIGFQWLPISVRVFLVRNINLGWTKKIKSYSKAFKLVNETRLLKSKEIKKLFKNNSIYKEKILGITKSFIVYKNKG